MEVCKNLAQYTSENNFTEFIKIITYQNNYVNIETCYQNIKVSLYCSLYTSFFYIIILMV